MVTTARSKANLALALATIKDIDQTDFMRELFGN
jgi:hypothetical protein